MDVKEKIKKEIERKRKLIKDSENIMKGVPKHLRPSQELALEIFKKELALLEQELMKLENKYESKNIYLDENEDEYMDLSNIRV
ncbi:MAG: hypothetical protein LOD89_04365 [Tissierellales bacterium]